MKSGSKPSINYTVQAQKAGKKLFEMDIHKETAKLLFSTESPTPEQRRMAKTLNFRSLYR